MDIWDKFRALCLASAFRCEECKDLKEMIRMDHVYTLNESTNEKLIKALDKHIKDNHSDRYQYLIIEPYPDWELQ